MCLNATTQKQQQRNSTTISSPQPPAAGSDMTETTSLSSNGSVETSSSASSTTSEQGEGEQHNNNNSRRHELHCEGPPPPPQDRRRHQLIKRSSSFQEAGFHITAGTLVSGIVVVFSLYFPFLLDPEAALKTYHFAFWNYDESLSLFDNSVWTYGTDYFLAACMLLILASIPSGTPITWRARGLLGCYMLSVIAGGVAHQFYETVESRNTASFRFLWRICVGTVAAASGFMGSTATELLRLDEARGIRIVLPELFGKSLAVPVIPSSFWLGYAIFTVLIVIFGGFSFQRPACDIFIAGITQFPSTFYVMLILAAGLPGFHISNLTRIAGCCGFILNAPLLPLYPVLVVRLGWNLPAVNTLLHTWLLVAWSMQGLSLRNAGKAVTAKECSSATTTTLQKTLLKQD